MAITAPGGSGRGRKQQDDDDRAPEDRHPTKAASLPRDTRTRPEYTQGKRAFEAGETDDDNPYPSGGERISWFTGYYDARTATKLAGVFERNKITWP